MIKCKQCNKQIQYSAKIQDDMIFHPSCITKFNVQIGIDKGYDICPICQGTTKEQYEVNVYPDGLPDSGHVWLGEKREKRCTGCNGKGYVDSEMTRKLERKSQYEKLKQEFEGL